MAPSRFSPGGSLKLSEAEGPAPRVVEAGDGLSGRRLDKALAESFSDLSRSRIHALIEDGAVRLNGLRARPSSRIRTGDRIELVIPPPIPSVLEPEQGNLQVRYEDDSLLVVAKPAGVVVHPGAGARRGTLAAALLAHCGTLSQIGGVLRPGIVHRLDKGTSGLMVVAKNDQAHQSLSTQFKARTVRKVYDAICLGTPRPARGSVLQPLGRDPRHRQRMAVVPLGRHARTDYEVTERLGPASVLRLILHTGRTHQIRVHMASLACPLVGDAVYGAAARMGGLEEPVRLLLSGFPRPALHARLLGFAHPVTGKALEFEEPWPKDLDDLRHGLQAAI